jgi:threonine aldolase
MREAPLTCAVGDDVYSEDPTVNQLQKIAARFLGKEAALYVPTGTMANLIAIGAHCKRGEELICGTKSHIFNYEGGGASAFLGVSMYHVPNHADGTLDVKDIREAIRSTEDVHCARTTLVAVENTQNMCGGRILTPEYMASVSQVCKGNGLKLHIDGARIANAAVALKTSCSVLTAGADSVSLCLSKGLGAPVGSILAGTEEFIYNANRLRKSFGGGMRQVGFVAATGIIALEQNVARLAQDHTHAQALAAGLAKLSQLKITSPVETNIVNIEVAPGQPFKAPQLITHLRERGILLGGGYSADIIRAVTNLNVNAADIELVVDEFGSVVRNLLVRGGV